MPGPDRIPCEIPFCRRTASRAKFPDRRTIIICGKCWRIADQKFRRVFRRAKREHDKYGGERHQRVMNWAWDRIKKQVTERKVGISG